MKSALFLILVGLSTQVGFAAQPLAPMGPPPINGSSGNACPSNSDTSCLGQNVGDECVLSEGAHGVCTSRLQVEPNLDFCACN